MLQMSTKNRGSRHRIPRERRLAIDISLVARRVPSFPVLRRMDLQPIELWRQELKASGKRIGWTAILAYAYGSVCRELPELRDVYIARPFPYMYRHPEPVASITIHRTTSPETPYLGRLVWGRFVCSETANLQTYQDQLDAWNSMPVEQIYPDALRLERWPTPIRRLQWYLLMRWTGRKRAKHLGTFSISSLAHLGALNGYHPLVTTTSLAMGPVSPNDLTEIVLLCDHRVVDGVLAAKALEMLEKRLEEIPKSLARNSRFP